MPKITIDDKEIFAQDGMTIIQACEIAGIEIPRFCYHEKLEIAGNCRMCLVEVEKSPKPVASCAQPVLEGMKVYTNTKMVKDAREGVMEFLLINHPLDCPICDQGGECDLQDQAMSYGKGDSRYHEKKRAVEAKDMGPLIQTWMTRCIHCTRCVRFLEDIAGTTELGAIGRGEHMEITTYIEKSISSELSGNIIDLCPVGALTSKPYAFRARSWELKKTESIDVLDAVGSNIRIDSKGTEVMRILPRLNESINEEWISDRTRFAYDGLKYQRLGYPMVRKNRKLIKSSWDIVFQTIADEIKCTAPEKIGAIAGDMVDVETMFVMKKLLSSIGVSNYDCRQDGSLLDNASRGLYIFNTTMPNIEKADLCLIIGSNPRHEAAILNARIRKACIKSGMKIGLIGEQINLNYPYKYLGNNPWIIKQIADQDHPFCNALAESKKPMLIIGAGAVARDDYDAVLYHTKRIVGKYNFIQNDWNGFNVLQTAASRVGGLDIGFVPGNNGLPTKKILQGCDLIFLIGADEVDLKLIPDSAFVIYQGHHADKAAQRADVILPGAAYTEKNGTYVNLEGRVQRAYLAIHPPMHAKQDWEIINELSSYLGAPLSYGDISDVISDIEQYNPLFKQLGVINKIELIDLDPGKSRSFTSDSFINPILNFYMNDAISRNSKTMAVCSQELNNAM